MNRQLPLGTRGQTVGPAAAAATVRQPAGAGDPTVVAPIPVAPLPLPLLGARVPPRSSLPAVRFTLALLSSWHVVVRVVDRCSFFHWEGREVWGPAGGGGLRPCPWPLSRGVGARAGVAVPSLAVCSTWNRSRTCDATRPGTCRAPTSWRTAPCCGARWRFVETRPVAATRQWAGPWHYMASWMRAVMLDAHFGVRVCDAPPHVVPVRRRVYRPMVGCGRRWVAAAPRARH